MQTTLYHPAFGGQIQASETILPNDPDGQVAVTVALMRQYAVEDAETPEIKADAAAALGSNPESLTEYEQAQRVWAFVNKRLTFVQDGTLSGQSGLDSSTDPVAEVLIRPRDMSVMGADSGGSRTGDCDDFSMYAASMLYSLGIYSSFVTIAADPAHPENFSHVYVAAYPDGQRVALDASHGSEFGWEHSNPARIEEWPLSSPILKLVAAALFIYVLLRGGI